MNISKSLFILFICFTTISISSAAEKIVIAHRGASGYLPEHTIAAKAMAYAMGVDYIEQDVVMTKDDQLLVLHDHYLDQVSDVQEKFPTRKRTDGRYNVIDFTMDEIRMLRVLERYKLDDKGIRVPFFPGRFPIAKSRFSFHTLEDEIELIQGLNKSTGGNIGIYPESKNPTFHLSEGKDLSRAILMTLKKYGYNDKDSKAYFQTFEIEELKRVHEVLLPELEMDVKLVQLMGNDELYNDIITAKGLKALATYADGIGPSIYLITTSEDNGATYQVTDLVKDAHAAGLDVHPYTFRRESFAVPPYAGDLNGLLDIFFNKIGVDGVFSDFPDLAVKFRDK